MTDSERLVHRFVDQDLSAGERVAFLVRLGRDEGVRQRLLELERLALYTEQLPKPVVPDGFVAGVMERIEIAPSHWRRILDALWAPRALQWNLASAMAAACLALVVGGGLIVRGRVGPAAPGPQGSGPLASTSVAPTAQPVLVRLVVLQPGARTVQAAGDFNGWDPVQTPLEQTSNGAWTVTIPLEPGRYEYMFVVDGQQWVADPFASEQHDDGFGSRNAVLDVRPPIGAPL